MSVAEARPTSGSGPAARPPEAPGRPYADYLRWLAEQDEGAALTMWREYLRDLDGPTRLAPAQAQDASAALPENCRGGLSADLTVRLQNFARARGLTLNTIVQGLWAVLLARLTGREDIVFGVTVSGRPAELAGIEQMIGLFINALPMRVRLDAAEPIEALLSRIQQSQSRMLAVQHIGLAAIQRAAGVANLFDTLLVYENYPVDQAAFAAPEDGLRVRAADGRDAVHFPLSLVVVPGEQLSLRLRYDPRLFAAARIEAMLAQLESLARQLVDDPAQTFRDFSLRAEAAKPIDVLDEPRFEPVTTLVARIAERSPDAAAIRQAGRAWTYAELMQRAREIAYGLVARGVERGEVVGIEGRKSFETVASMLGVMMSGGAMLTLDPNLPEQRRAMMLSQCRVRFVLGTARAAEPCPLPVIEPEDRAYVFFTSGSTGTPKGVLGWHKGLAHFIDWEAGAFEVGADDRVAQLIHLSFDPMLRDIFLPLTRGATLCIPQPEDEADGEQLVAWMQREGITLMHAVPSLARWWLKTAPGGRSVPSLRWTLFAGEPLMGETVRQWRAAFSPSGGVANFYGPTETTLAKCAYRVPADPHPGLQPVGWPLPQTEALVVTATGKLCGIGEPGEVVLRTPFRSLGYIGANAPWKPNPLGGNDTVYYTGDAGRYLPDGSLEIIGRVDDQVKIRGVRIDPHEIAAVLLEHPRVSECFVMARESDGEKRLVAYVVTTESERALITYAAERLPEFMVPASIVVLSEMPLTRNGKIDRQALPDPVLDRSRNREHIPPRNAVELRLARLWQDVLGRERIGMRDDFFDVGGHSLAALRLIARIASDLGVRLPAAAVFRHRTIEDLAAALRDRAPWSPLVPIQTGGPHPPLFCVHPLGGLALGYTELARGLGPDQPFYGLQSVGMEPGQEPLDSIEAMAALYVTAIRELLPDGPYFLAGYSYGGRVAYEMAQQLVREGKEVALLALLDSASPSVDTPAVDVDDAALLLNLMPEDFGITVEELRVFDADEQLAYVVRKAHERGLVPPDFDADGLRRFLRVYKSNLVAGNRYRLAPYPGAITLLQTEPRAGWEELAQGGIEIHTIPGTHMTLMQPPAVHALAERLRECIRKGERNAQSV